MRMYVSVTLRNVAATSLECRGVMFEDLGIRDVTRGLSGPDAEQEA